ncbi:lysophospholipid acyltransferase family protein [Hydrogenovibrio kuenenii]|uniref:lysophospholipid acyltransferase family protein n=1 Tax=Hydrogenovibrio kuenenii TaxID=63658 RepID=UPI000467A117|nr:hypothetical protein [Hydrogenovibrio kuenenii]
MSSPSEHEIEFKLSFLLPKYWGIWLGYGLLRLIGFLPYATKIHFGEALGKFLYLIAGSRKQTAKQNIEIAFPEKNLKEINSLVFEHFKSLGVGLIEITITAWGKHRHSDTNNEMNYFTYYGVENIKLNKDHGTLLLVPHFASMEMSGLMLSFITDYMPIYRKHDNPLLEYLLTKSRTILPTPPKKNTVTPLPNTDTKTMLKALRNHQVLWIAPDQKYNGQGSINVPFFNKPAPTNPGINKLAKLGKAKVIPCFTKRKGLHYEMHILPPLENFPSGDDYEDTLRLHKLYEEEIRQNPAQYLWVHNRWSL